MPFSHFFELIWSTKTVSDMDPFEESYLKQKFNYKLKKKI